MTPPTLLVELAEKMGLLAAAALVAVLFPPLRNRLLGVGRRVDKLAAVGLGFGLSVWGATLGLHVAGEDINVRAIGILIAAILGGWKAGLLAGLGGGLFYAFQVDPQTAPYVLIASVVDGVLAGVVAERKPEWVEGPRVFFTAIAVQGVHLFVVGVGLVAFGYAERYLPAWPAHLVKLVVNGAGVTLFVMVARLVISREERGVALAHARAAADKAALEALRRRLEPHFLFNALTAIRATIRRDPEAARELVSDLADLYRYLLSHPDDAPLSAEIDHASAYLAIERARLGEGRVRVDIDVPAALRAHRVPALLLQPLVENAVRHGVARRSGAGTIRIGAHEDGDSLVIEVEDACEGDPVPANEKGSGIALATLRERLGRLFGDRAAIDLDVGAMGARASVKLPLEAQTTSSGARVLASIEERANA
ncbi:sensor histidine kinase [Sandaracinus amylolyticus]|uniref:Autolysin sensor kinase n=1 Tax=Sandaracinus amylolyticus TaxID=927083 RepID=A0A0F6YH82_9BACT|nr:histidine kinase [Sandaracinus amylolyticus]AKF05445.1 Autolysin sensor kinase [Sandaracinus amylolyticus]